jgi:hypothetical protein
MRRDHAPRCTVGVLWREREQRRSPVLISLEWLFRSGVMQRNGRKLNQKRMPWMTLMWSQGGKVPHLVANQRCE